MPSYIKYIFITLIFSLFCNNVSAQENQELPVDGKIYAFQIGLGGSLPFEDLKERFGGNLNFSFGGEYLSKNNWLFSSEFIYYYSENIKEDILKPYRTAEGLLIGDDQQYADIKFRQRAIYVGASVGKVIGFSSKTRSGLGFSLGGGLLAHKIIFSDDRNSVAQVRAGRNIGYDRLTRGAAIKETISYKLRSLDRKLNLDFALDFTQAFTSEVRAINFDTGLPTIPKRMDVLIGARIIWTLPYYHGGKEATIYY
jgi:hypothetical protein